MSFDQNWITILLDFAPRGQKGNPDDNMVQQAISIELPFRPTRRVLALCGTMSFDLQTRKAHLGWLAGQKNFHRQGTF